MLKLKSFEEHAKELYPKPVYGLGFSAEAGRMHVARVMLDEQRQAITQLQEKVRMLEQDKKSGKNI